MRAIFDIIVISIFIPILSFSQYKEGNGYLILKDKSQKQGIIQFKNWDSAPDSITIISNELKEKISTSDLIEFGVDNEFKFIKKNVEIDIKRRYLGKITNQRIPELREESLFLKVLIEGKASLYKFSENDLDWYFYSIDSSKIEQLIYRKYEVNSEVRELKMFQQQLNNSFSANSTFEYDYHSLKYKEYMLLNLFLDYNNTNNDLDLNLSKRTKKWHLNLVLRPGLRSSKLNEFKISNDQSNSIRIGLNTKIILPMRSERWAINLEPVYHNLEYKDLGFKYETLEFNTSFSYSIIKKKDIQLYLSAGLGTDYIIDQYFEGFNFTGATYLIGGVGSTYKNFGIELRASSRKNILSEYINYNTNITAYEVILGYTFFKN
ncbi:hypothetical protein [Marinigracilibium pacificum]|uniref:Uncharacterized protein n=1 Tax=Marinigracilibium pacificum TaxID=2729599 RepID=A0A848IY54_9BACT|nr:hypothetical protein [Marinigracilibium pacificum]NMM48098.1 hypothetical protein [Marinigracilibium pacificum]